MFAIIILFYKIILLSFVGKLVLTGLLDILILFRTRSRLEIILHEEFLQSF